MQGKSDGRERHHAGYKHLEMSASEVYAVKLFLSAGIFNEGAMTGRQQRVFQRKVETANVPAGTLSRLPPRSNRRAGVRRFAPG